MDAEKKIKELQELMLKLEEKYKGDFDKIFKDIEKNLNEDDIDKCMSFQPEEKPDSLITYLFNSIQNSKESEEDKKKKFEKYAQMIKKLSLEKQERLKQKYKLSQEDKDNFLKKLEALAVKAEKEELQEEDNKSLRIGLYKFMPNATEEEQEKAIGLMQSIQEKQRAFLDKCKKDQLKQIEEMKNAEEKEKNKDNTEKTDNAEPSAEPNIEEKVAGSQEDVVEPNVVVPPVESRKKEEDVSKESDDEKIDFSNRKKISLLKKKKHRSKSFSRRKKSLSLRRRKQFDILDKKDKQIANLKAEVEHERDKQIANLKAEVEDLKNLLDKFESGQSLRKKRNMLGRKKSRKRAGIMEDSYQNIQERKNMKNKGTLYQKRQTDDRQPEI